MDPLQPDLDDMRFENSWWFPDGKKVERPWRKRAKGFLGIKRRPAPKAGPGSSAIHHQRERWYGVSALPVVSDTGSGKEAGEVRRLVYVEALGAWKQLVDVRFKLLGLIPAVSIVALATLAGEYRDASDSARLAMSGIGLAGFLITVGLWIYDKRNSQLHDDLLSRARRAESELGVHTGVVLGRLGSRGLIKHDTATGLVYLVVVMSWLVTTVVMVFAA